jgi:hypothetical protein
MLSRTKLAILCFTALCATTAGCQYGRLSASVNSDTPVPTLGINMLPRQWEPEVVEAEDDFEAGNGGSKKQ